MESGSSSKPFNKGMAAFPSFKLPDEKAAIPLLKGLDELPLSMRYQTMDAIKEWQLFRHLNYLMKKTTAECIDLMHQQPSAPYSHTRKRFYLRCSFSHPIWDLVELQRVIQLKVHPTGLLFSFHK